MLKSSIKHVFSAFYHSWLGLKATYGSEKAFRIELFLSVILLPMAFIISDNCIHRIFLIGSWFLVLIMELVNTAIETIIDRISLDHHPQSGKAKDIGSAVVLLSCFQAAFIWSIFTVKWLF